MVQIIGRPGSINVRKVLWTCAETGTPFELAPPDAQLRSLNPNGLVPVLRDGGFVLWESNTICRYLATTCDAATLLPRGARERAGVEQWMDWQATELNNSWRYAFMALVRRSPAHTDPGAIAAGIVTWNAHMRILDDRLRTSGGHVAGAAFTLADIGIGLSVHRWLMTPMERPRLTAIDAYYDRLSERPAFLAHGRNGLP